MIASAIELAVVFDMDGVLVDTSSSYDRAVVLTVERYLRHVLGAASELATPAAVRALRQAGGFNNDWDLSYALLVCAVERPALGLAEFHAICEAVRGAGGGIDAVAEVLGRSEIASRRFRGVEYDGDVESGNRVKRLFQQIYLGGSLFRALYRSKPESWSEAGLIDDETPMLDRGVLALLASQARLAIATGRPRAEAQHAIERFGWSGVFDPIVTLDDCPPGRRKPNPYPLQQAFDGIDARAARGANVRIYVGDLPDDLRAARAAASAYREPLLFFNVGQLDGADARLQSPNELPDELRRRGWLPADE
ncbi:MAG: HAD hydrolase-like protein [Myxococcales bacterium]|nr:HAD hydrolase-like protein [Myxococcales bacterium]